MEENNRLNEKVSWKIFIWIIGVMIIILGWIFAGMAATNNRVNHIREDSVEIKMFMSEVKTDLGWIKEQFKRINTK